MDARTANTITTMDALRQEIQTIRRQGYSVDEEEYHSGVRSLAAPIRDAAGHVIGAIGITASTLRLTKGKIPKMAKTVCGVADEISDELGNH